MTSQLDLTRVKTGRFSSGPSLELPLCNGIVSLAHTFFRIIVLRTRASWYEKHNIELFRVIHK